MSTNSDMQANDGSVRLPEGINSLFPAKILVRTGPAYKDEGCTQAADIEVDLVPPGTPNIRYHIFQQLMFNRFPRDTFGWQSN
jgi:hypothetical protein